jgi:hypothetical protein
VLPELPASFGETRGALHALAEQVVSAAYFHATTHIGLRPTPRGFGTPVFRDRERVRVDTTALVHERGNETRRHELTTLRAASAFVGVPLGAPSVFTPTTSIGAEAPLRIERDAALALADWYALSAALLADLKAAHAEFSASESQLWPEHFDLACELGDADAGTRANYGASPGDSTIPEPYLYVGPWDAERRTGELGAYPFGAACTYSELRRRGGAGAAGRQFYERAAALLLG